MEINASFVVDRQQKLTWNEIFQFCVRLLTSVVLVIIGSKKFKQPSTKLHLQQ